MSAPPLIDTDGLPPATAAIIRALLEELIAANPGLTGFQLAGSYWNPASQLDGADIDVRRFGEVTPGADPRLAAWQVVFEFRGRLIDLAEWVFGDLGDPPALSLRDAVSFSRARILWARDASLHELAAQLAGLLRAPAWHRPKIDQALARCADRFAELRAAHPHVRSLRKSVSPITDSGYFKHVFYTVVDELAGLISVLDFRPPSLARKALLEIADGLSALQLPHLLDSIYGALGCAELSETHCRDWLAEVEALYLLAAAINPGVLLKRRYHLSAVHAALERGEPRAAVFPLWRALEECRSACELLPPYWLMPTATPNTSDLRLYRELRDRADAGLATLREQLGFDSEAAIADRIAQSIAVVDELSVHRARFHGHFAERVLAWIPAD